jgi:hypothetical protein
MLMMSGKYETCFTDKIIRPYPSPFLVSSPVAFKFLNVLVLNIAVKIARWTLNTNQSSVQDYIYRTKLFPEHFMSIPICTKMLTKPPKQKSKTHLIKKKHTFKKKELAHNTFKLNNEQ